MKAATRNLTLALPVDLIKKIKVIAAKRDTSISAMVGQSLQRIADEEPDPARYERAKRGFLKLMERGVPMKHPGEIPWKREDRHDRGKR